MQSADAIPGLADLVDNLIAQARAEAAEAGGDGELGRLVALYEPSEWVVERWRAAGGAAEQVAGDGATPPDPAPLVWCGRGLNAQLNLGDALADLRRVATPEGWVAFAAPAMSDGLSEGQLTPGWSVGQLAYALAMAGFDLSEARFVEHGGFIGALARPGRGAPARPEETGFADAASTERWPPGLRPRQGLAARLSEWNWRWWITPAYPTASLAAPPRVSGPARRSGPPSISFFVPWITQGRGGTEHVGSEMANLMARRGWRVAVHTFDDQERPPTWPLEPSIRLAHHSEKLTPAAETDLLARLAVDQPDLVVGLHMSRMFFAYVWAARRLGAPVLLSEHLDPKEPLAAGAFGAAERVAVFSGAERIHLLTEAFRSSLPDFLQPRIRVAPNTVTPPNALADPIGPTPGAARTVLAVARLIKRKNLHTLISAFATARRAAPDWRLEIVGYGPEMETLKARATELGIAGDVTFAGRLENAYPAFARAQLFALPSHSEGFPMTVLEAMAHGLPTLAYADCPGANEQVSDGETGFLARRDDAHDSFADQLATLMGDADLRGRMGAAARARFDRLYAPERVHATWAEMFEETIEAGLSYRAPSLQTRAGVALARMIEAGPAAFQAQTQDERLQRL